MKVVDVVCCHCGKMFQRKLGEVRRKERDGTKNYCSNKCQAHLKRIVQKKICAFCGKEVEVGALVLRTNKTGNFFCDRTCASRFNGKIRAVEVLCENCGGEIPLNRKWRNKYCSSKCCADSKYKDRIRKWLAGEITGNDGLSGEQTTDWVRRYCFERAGGKCEALLEDGTRCNWSRKNPITGRVPLSVHHKNGNYKETMPDNLILICPNCHSLTSNYGSLNRGKGRKNRLKKLRVFLRASPGPPSREGK